MKTKIAILCLALTLVGCRFNKSVKVDLISGLTTKGDLISCEDVYITVNNDKVSRNTFTYGEKIYLNFNNIDGLKKENGKVFPGMELSVTSKSGDTLLQFNDLYSSYTEGIDLSPLLLTADLTVASPIHSNGDYSLFIKIWDKKDKGTYTAKLDFKITPDENITVEPDKVSYKEIYLFSKVEDRVITDCRVKVNEETYFLFEGLSGFSEEGGKVFPGLSIKATDDGGEILLNTDDLFADYNESGIIVSDFLEQVSSNFLFPSADIKNPVHCVVSIWDKKSDAKIAASINLLLEK